MHWEVLLIPLIALVVVILSTIFGGQKPQPGEGQEPENELERFLAESRKRREGEVAPVQEPPPPVPQAREEKPPAPPAPAKRRDPSRAEAKSERRPPIRQTPGSSSLAPLPSPEEPAIDPAEVQRTLLRRLPRRKASPALSKVTQLLRTPESIQTAFILAEIFQPPLSRRPPSEQ